jgi:hypothetical protein
MSSDPFRPISGTSAAPKKAGEWTPIVPVPDDTPPPPAEHPKLGKPTETYTYRAADGEVNGHVMRFDLPGGKEFRPLTYCRHPAGRLHEWRWSTWQKPRPLFNIDKLHQRPVAPVLVVEGEKASRAAEQLAPGHVCITSPGGSKAAAQADWTPLNGREVVIWPDNDDPGRQYAAAVAKHCGEAGAARVSIIEPPHGMPAGWDAADALAEGFDEAQVTRLIVGAVAARKSARREGTQHQPGDDADRESGRRQRGRPPQRDQLMVYLDGVELWHDDENRAYATFTNHNGRRENAAVDSQQFRHWITLRYYDDHGGSVGKALDEFIRTAEALAGRGPRCAAHIRVAEHNGRIYLDLCNDEWQAVECTRHNWDVIDNPPVKFIRRPGMLPLPIPERVTEQLSGIAGLRSLFPNLSQTDFALCVTWLMSCTRDTGMFPILIINGMAGSGKSSLTKMLVSLIDPKVDDVLRPPKDERDVFSAAGQSWLIAYENVSRIPAWLSNALCSIATGAAYSKTKFYRDFDHGYVRAKRPVVINAIPDLVEAEDLASRAFILNLPPLIERVSEIELERRCNAARPRILAGVLDGVCHALRNVGGVRLSGSSTTRQARLCGIRLRSKRAKASCNFMPTRKQC